MKNRKISWIALSLCVAGLSLNQCSSDDSSGGAAAGTGGSAGSKADSGGTGGSGTGGTGGAGTGGTGGASGTGGAGGSTSDGGGDADATTGTQAIHISSPTEGQTFAIADLDDGTDLPIAFTVDNFTLKPPGTCAGATNCGHIHVVVDPDVGDGKTCNGPGAPYNEYFPETADAAPGSTSAGLDYCPAIPGTHKIVLELHNDDHSPFKIGANVVSASVGITVSADDGGTEGGAEGGDAATDAGGQ